MYQSSAFIGSKNQAALREQAFATPDKINLLLDELQASVTSKLDTLLAQIQLYITNQSTQLLLCRPVSDQTIGKWFMEASKCVRHGRTAKEDHSSTLHGAR